MPVATRSARRRPPRPAPASTTVEAESGTLSGAARLASCSACSGGQKVGFIGNGSTNHVTLSVTAATSGTRQMTIAGLVNGTRTFFVSVNGGAGIQVPMTGTSFATPITTSINVTLNAGTNTIRFYNDTAYAPDLDKIDI